MGLDLAEVTGTYVADGRPRRSARASYDQTLARTLWDVSAALTHLPKEIS